MKIVRSKYLPPSRRFSAMNLFGVFFVHPRVRLSKRLINHESIHTAQMREMLYVPFYVVYVIEWLIRLLLKGDAYRNISFEREAYRNDGDLHYLENRKHYAWLRYMRKRKRRKYKERRIKDQ